MTLGATDRAKFDRAISFIESALRRLESVLGLPGRIDPELDNWVKQAFADLKRTRLFEPTRDMSRAVLDHIKRMQDSQNDLGNRSIHT